MTESDILRIWNGPTSVCNKAKILQFAADLEVKFAERNSGAVALIGQIAELFHIGDLARTPSTILANIRNTIRRANCLDAIEREFFTKLVEDEDEGGKVEECSLNWGDEPAQYVERFRSALNEISAESAQDCEHDWRDYYTGTKVTQHICAKCNMKRLATEPVATPAAQEMMMVPVAKVVECADLDYGRWIIQDLSGGYIRKDAKLYAASKEQKT